jgi:hypothetical protein
MCWLPQLPNRTDVRFWHLADIPVTRSLAARLTAGPRLGRMSPRGHPTLSTSENGGVIKKCNLIEIKFF